MDKRLFYANNLEKERDIFFVREDRGYLKKQASSYHPKIAEYIEKARPLPNLIQVLITSLGAFDAWGQNNNGDRFRTEVLSHPGKDYGYETFLTNANYFTHHVNSNPALAKGKVILPVWNDRMLRVELILGIDPTKDPDAGRAIDSGENLCFSMGCKTPYDVCSICSNQAKTRAEYCDHARYMMGMIDPETGKLVGVDNPFPKFFDISRVLIPADKTAYLWEKIASPANPYTKLASSQLAELPPEKLNDVSYLLQKVAENEELSKQAKSKKASVKRATLTKRIELPVAKPLVDQMDQSVPIAQAALRSQEVSIPKEKLEELKKLAPTIEHLLSTILLLGIKPHNEELDQLPAPTGQLGCSLFHEPTAQAILPLMEDRSYARPVLVRRIIILANKSESNPELIKKAMLPHLELAATHPGKKMNVTPLMVAGMAAALYSLLGKQFVLNHPLLSIALGATGLAGINSMRGLSEMGEMDLDRSPQGLYNQPWQSGLRVAQAQPVTVIKTGAEKVDTSLAKKMFFGVPAVFMGSHLLKSKEEQGQKTGPVSHFVAHNPDVVSGGLILEHMMGKPISKHVSQALESGKRLFKSASLHDIEFLSNLPEGDQPLFWDLAILDAAQRIQKNLGGRNG